MEKNKALLRPIQILEGALSLLVVFLLLAASVMYGGKLFGKNFNAPESSGATASPAAMAVVAPTAGELKSLGLDGVQVTAVDTAVWNVLGASGESLGAIVSSVKAAKDVQGYAGTTPLLLYIDKEETIRGVVAQENDETPDFFESALAVLDKMKGRKVADVPTLTVDAVSGATFSSKALIENVRRAAAVYGKTEAKRAVPAPAIGWWRTVAVLAVLAFGVVVSYRFKGNKRMRLAVLALNVGVLGFWTGQFISLGLLRSWIANGVDVIVVLPAFAMVVLTIVLSFLGHKHHHCTWVCPYGSLQELAYRLPVPKIKVKPVVYKYMRYVRQAVLCALLFAAWMGVAIDGVLEFEPFSAFLVNAAAPGVMILAGVFVLTSLFVPSLWCRAFCPVGEVLQMSYDTGKAVLPKNKKVIKK